MPRHLRDGFTHQHIDSYNHTKTPLKVYKLWNMKNVYEQRVNLFHTARKKEVSKKKQYPEEWNFHYLHCILAHEIFLHGPKCESHPYFRSFLYISLTYKRYVKANRLISSKNKIERKVVSPSQLCLYQCNKLVHVFLKKH